MHFIWPMTTVVLFISFFDDGKVKGSNLEIQVTRKLKEMIELKEHLESLQKDIEKHISPFLNNNGLLELNSIVQGLANETVIRINFGKKIDSMLEAYGQQLADLVTRVDNIDLDIESRLLANTNATEVSFLSKLEETVSTIEHKCTGSMSKLNQTLGSLYEQINQWRVPKQVHGGWTAWGSWTRCTATCGKGVNIRVRTCTNPAPANGGNDCVGVALEYNECQINSCEANGGWTSWGSWSTCSSSCGNDLRQRNRTCTNPVPANGRQYCDGQPTEYSNCQIQPCEVHGGWTAWGSWTRCTATCGKGVNIRVRTCTNPAPANGGNDCVGVALEYNECQINSCEANGGWTLWGSWSTCSSSCGNGLCHRSRTCTNPVPANGGQYCDGQPTEYSNCQIQPCEDNGNVKGSNLEVQVTQKLNEMIDLKEHLESLQKDNERYISSLLNNNGVMKINSMVQALAQEKVIRINFRKKINSLLEAYGQQLADLVTTVDNIDRHIENRLVANTNAIEAFYGSKLEETVSTVEQKFKGSISKLNHTLDNLCEQINQCRVPKQVHGVWTAWESWTRCTATCGKGIINRVRTCTNPAPASGGNYCVGVPLEYNECQISSCEANGGWTLWGSWSTCSSSCGNGILHRSRTCTNPVPANGGQYCDGQPTEYSNCQIKPCEEHGGWTAWELWTKCTSTCGKGIINRVRTCTNPAPASGGNYCVGVPLEYNECQLRSCQANGGWTLWGSWSTCSSSCGNGILHRSRTCTNPVPANGGQYCDGQPTEYTNCQIKPCEAPHCGDGWTKFQSSCYAFIHREMSWFAAEQYCQVFGSHLIRIDDYNELQFIRGKLYEFHKTKLKEGTSTDSVYWTAGNDIMQEGHWVLAPLNVPMRYMYWFENEPNNDNGGEHCVDLAYTRKFQMNDLRCHLNGFVICEIDRKNG